AASALAAAASAENPNTSATSVLTRLIGAALLSAVELTARPLGLEHLPRRRGRRGRPGQLPHLDVDAAVELLGLPAGLVAGSSIRADGHRPHRGLGDAQLDHELLDRLGPALGELLVVLGRPLAIGIPLDENGPAALPVHLGGLLLEHPDRVGPEPRAL